MCGIAGFARHPQGAGWGKATKALTRMVEGVDHRGGHATGFACAGGASEFVWKIAMPMNELVKSKRWHAELGRVDSDTSILLAHTRYATLPNGHKDESAHPFRQGATVGAHNGIIRNWQQLQREYPQEDTKGWTVDSEAAIYLLDRMADPCAAIRRLEGAYALTWVKDGMLHFVRNTNPICCAYIPQMRALFWASTEGALFAALKYAGIAFDRANCWLPQPHVVYSFDVAKFDAEGAHPQRANVRIALDTSTTVQGDVFTTGESYAQWHARKHPEWEGPGQAVASRRGAARKAERAKKSASLADLINEQQNAIDRLEKIVATQGEILRNIISRCDTLEANSVYALDCLQDLLYASDAQPKF